MTFAPRRYLAFLLRLWQVRGEDGGPAWRASLEDANTGERLGFASLGALVTFLEDQIRRYDLPSAPRSEQGSESTPSSNNSHPISL